MNLTSYTFFFTVDGWMHACNVFVFVFLHVQNFLLKHICELLQVIIFIALMWYLLIYTLIHKFKLVQSPCLKFPSKKQHFVYIPLGYEKNKL